VITYDRPGYGGSVRLPGRPAKQAAADVAAIADALELGEFAVVGISGGGPHALAVAAQHRRRISRCATVVGLGPYGVPDLDFYAGMSLEETGLWRLVEQGAEPVAERVVPELEAWLESLKTGAPMPGLGDWERQMLIEAFDEAFVQGAGGVIDDYLALVRPWEFDVATVTVPTQIMVGREDEAVPPSHGQWLVNHIPGAVLVEVPGGHFGPHEQEEEALLTWLATGDMQ
jgi:pimeloyl-ACP methyl ester carboxylesterase